MIRMEGLCRSYGSVRAVRDLTLEVPAGELFCFLGPNGAGKTTTIKMLTGLLHPTAGQRWISGIDVGADPVGAKQVMGYIPDTPFLYDRLTVSEFFFFTADLYGIERGRARSERTRYFDDLGLHEYADVLTRDLSHGLRQRLLYASALLHEPRVLFIDEPLIGLDPYTIRSIKDMLRSRVESGMTIFLTTHILALAEEIGDRIGIISHGRLVALGGLAELLREHPGHRSLEDLFLALTRQPDPEA